MRLSPPKHAQSRRVKLPSRSSNDLHPKKVKINWKRALMGLGLLQGLVLLGMSWLHWLISPSQEVLTSKISPHHLRGNSMNMATREKTNATIATTTEVGGKPSQDIIPLLIEVARSNTPAINNPAAIRPCNIFSSQDEPLCTSNDAVLVAFNPVGMERTWCGQVIPPNGTLTVPVKTLSSACRKEPARILTHPQRIPVAQVPTDFPPIRLYNGKEEDTKNKAADVFKDCDVPCHTIKPWNGGILSQKRVEGTPWMFTFSMESPRYYKQLVVDPDGHLENKFWATTSWESEVPLPYFSWAEYKIQGEAVRFDKAIPAASFIAKNCQSKNNREATVQNLMKHIRVDSLSTCLKNAKPPEGVSMKDKRALQRQYLFHLAFENSNELDYVTEKMWGTFESGTLPIYFGAPNIQDHVPEHSIISVHDFKSVDDVGVYVNQVMKNKTLYESYHQWRTRSLPDSFQRKYNITHTHSTCRMCRWSYAKKWGLAWDHQTQTIQDLHASRQLQVDSSTGALRSPVQESWHISGQNTVASTAQATSDPHSIRVESWQRTLFEHDGVVDVHFERHEQGQKLIYSMEASVKGAPLKSLTKSSTLSNTLTWQDAHSRVTVVANWDASIEADTTNGSVKVMLDDSIPNSVRIRIISEAVDTFHTTGQGKAYYFGKTMRRDFLNPVEVFRVNSPI